MKFKKEVLILSAIIIVLGLYLWNQARNQGPENLPKPTAVESSKLNRLLITKPDKKVLELQKKDEKWFIEPQNYVADSIKVNNMTNALADLKVTALVSSSGSYERYDLTDAEKINVQAFADKDKLRDLDIGRLAPTNQHTFVKLAGDTNVYHARGNLKRTFDQTVDGLRDKLVFSFEKDNIDTLELQKGDQKLTLVKNTLPAEPDKNTEKKNSEKENTTPKTKTQWQDDQGRVVDQAAVASLLRTLSHLQCDTFMADNAKDQLKDALWQVHLKSAQGQYGLSLFTLPDKQEKRSAGLSTTNPYAFLLAQTRVKSVETVMDRLLGQTKQK